MTASRGRCLIFVHAHPDDECLATGGTIARYSHEGARVVLVTCTNGEVGEIAEVPGLGTAEEIRPRLGEIRAEELRAACRELGDVDIRMLGYHDSGMAGTAENSDPRAFVNQDADEAVARVVEIVREAAPDVLVTYNEYGFYGHPDHIRAHEIAMAAIDAAADASYRPELGAPHRIAKAYYNVVPKSLLAGARDMTRQFGGSPDDFFSEEEVERIGTNDEDVTTWIDVAEYVDRKFRALEAHKTQRGTTEQFLRIPEDIRSVAMGQEHYLRVRPETTGGGRETDLFEGLS